MDPPNACELGTIISGIEIIVLEEALVEQLERPGGRIVRGITVVGDTCEGGLLIAARTRAETSVVLDMQGKG